MLAYRVLQAFRLVTIIRKVASHFEQCNGRVHIAMRSAEVITIEN